MVSSRDGTTLLAARRTASEPSVRAISASRRWTVGDLCFASASIARDPHHFVGIARKLDEPDHGVDVGPILQERDHRHCAGRAWDCRSSPPG